jgi:transposase
VRLVQAKWGFVLLPRRWEVERSFGGMSRFRRLMQNYERPNAILIGLHFVAFAPLMLQRAVAQRVSGS